MLADFATDVTCLVLASDAKFLESEAAIADYFYHYAFVSLHFEPLLQIFNDTVR